MIKKFRIWRFLSVKCNICWLIFIGINLQKTLKKKQLCGPFLWMRFNCLKARATPRRQFTFNHWVPKNSWYSFYRPRKNERLSQPWSHPVILNMGHQDWESSDKFLVVYCDRCMLLTRWFSFSWHCIFFFSMWNVLSGYCYKDIFVKHWQLCWKLEIQGDKFLTLWIFFNKPMPRGVSPYPECHMVIILSTFG